LIEQTGWKEGDTLDIQLEDGAIIIKKLWATKTTY
jgi:bifunctional DNA-binding transcriptional regulator/antitoxin component of YhaV-PrlF toxin-antitoxin module